MQEYYSLPKGGSPAAAAAELARLALETGIVQTVLCTAENPNGPVPMPALFTDPEQAAAADPLAPAAMVNMGALAARTLRGENGHDALLMLRPCEARALVELAKLQQCRLDHAVVLGMDCLGRLERQTYLQTREARQGAVTQDYLQDESLQDSAAATCTSCEAFTPEGADAALHFLGGEALLCAQSEKGREFCQKLGLSPAQEPKARGAAVAALQEKRAQARQRLMAETRERAGSMASLQRFLASCIACHNCRVACPVCYCRECVFTSDVYRHDGQRYFNRAAKRGLLRLPADTTMYHLTRMAHMAHACVGCGQCSSACPSDIPVADLFRMTAAAVQQLYDYAPGRSLEDPIPYLAFDQPAGAKE